MKQVLDINEQEISQSVREFIFDWKEKKQYLSDSTITLGQCIELLIGVSYNLHKDSSDGRFFNKILTNNESIIGWDGEELIDILFYEITQTIKRRIARAGTFTEELIP